jgi:DNA helicase-2/ATP-dependent DNA helicase PcrA
VCYLIRVEPKMYPHVRSLGKRDEEEEERRVLYVAMTRAKDELIITRSCCCNGSTVFYGGAVGSHSEGGSAYLLERLPDDLASMETQGFDPGAFADYEVIQPWRGQDDATPVT